MPKKTRLSLKEKIVKHRAKIATVLTLSFALWMNRLALAQHTDFLKEKGLYDEFFNDVD